MVSTYRNGKSDVWVTNLQFRNQIIPRGMCIGQAEPLNEGHLCVISDTSAAKTNVKHRIFTGDHAPINQRAYRVSPTERRIIHEEVQKMLDEVEWRHEKDAYPLPRIDDTLDCLKGAKFFFHSWILRSGYWQTEIDEADREKTAFITPRFHQTCHGVRKKHTVQLNKQLDLFLTLGARYNTGLRTCPTGDELCFYTFFGIFEKYPVCTLKNDLDSSRT
ncbi:transposon Ty3-I Gag-Pol polyprotein [Trichonephila clavipes]|nr:transposon Ty3-I Gag-Pol polyprotein [Trichonephila clavipes]